MQEVAALGLRVESDGVLSADDALDKFAASADKASASAEKVEAAAKRGGRGAGELSSGAQQAMRALDALSKAEGSAASRAVEMAEAAQRAAAASSAASGGVGGLAQGFDILTGRLNTNFVAINKNLQQLGLLPGALKQATVAANDNAGAMKANVGNIAAQFQDIGVTAAMGMNPLLIALQQGTQLSGVFAQSGVSAGAALVGAFKSVFSVTSVLTVGIVALSAYLIQLGIDAISASGEADKLTKALDNAKLSSSNLADGQSILGEVFDLTTGKIKDQTDATMALARAMAMQSKIQAEVRQQEASNQLDSMAREKWGVTGGMGGGLQVQRFYGATAGVVDTFKNGGYGKDGAVAAQKQLERMVKLGQATKEEYLAASSAIVNFAAEAANIARSDKMLAALGGDKGALEPFLNRPAPKKDRQAENLAREMAAREALINGLYKAAEAYDVSTAAGLRARIEAEAMEKGIRRQADVQAYAAQMLRKYVAEQVSGAAEQTAAMRDQTKAMEFVNQAVRSGSLDADKASDALANMTEQQKLMTAMTVAQLNNDKQGYDAAKKALQGLTDAQIANNRARRDAADLQQAAQIDRATASVKLETKLTRNLGAARIAAMKGLSGTALEDELARIAAQHEIIAIQARAEADAARELAMGNDDAAKAIMRKAEADKTQAKVRQSIDEQTRAIQRYNDAIRETIDALDRLGGIGQGLGAVLGIVTGNTSSIRGPLGSLLNMGMTTTDRDGRKIATTIGGEISKVFTKGGAFSQTLTTVLQGAATGGIIGGAFFPGSSGGQIGATIGGAFGKKFGEQFLSKGLDSVAKGLGNFAGPIGTVLGSVAGGLLGSLFKSTKKGYANLTSGADGIDITNSGNSGTRINTSNSLANALGSSLNKIADAFGGKLAAGLNLGSLGVRDDKFTFDPTPGSKAGRVEYKTAEEATRAALEFAISQGVITGIRDSTARILQSGKDLDAALQDALSFQSVFDQLDQIKDPTAFALKQVENEFSKLRDIFQQAGASAEEYAQLEQLLTIKRQEAMQKEADAVQDVRSRIAEVQGDNATVKAIERARELRDAMSDQVRSELQRLYAIEDATEAQDKLMQAQKDAAAAADQLRSAWQSIGNDLLEEVQRIRGLTGAEQGMGYAALLGQFNSTIGLARSGDKDAAGRLTGLSQSLLDAAEKAATSRQELDRIRAQTAAALEGVYNSIGIATPSSAGNPFPTGATSSGAASADGGSLPLGTSQSQFDDFRQEMRGALASIINNTGRTAKTLENVTPLGDAISVSNSA